MDVGQMPKWFTQAIKFHRSHAESVFYYYILPEERKRMDWSSLHCYYFPKSLLCHHSATSIGDRDVHTRGKSDVHRRYHVYTHIPMTHPFHIAVDGHSVLCHLGVVLHSLLHSSCLQQFKKGRGSTEVDVIYRAIYSIVSHGKSGSCGMTTPLAGMIFTARQLC